MTDYSRYRRPGARYSDDDDYEPREPDDLDRSRSRRPGPSSRPGNPRWGRRYDYACRVCYSDKEDDCPESKKEYGPEYRHCFHIHETFKLRVVGREPVMCPRCKRLTRLHPLGDHRNSNNQSESPEILSQSPATITTGSAGPKSE